MFVHMDKLAIMEKIKALGGRQTRVRKAIIGELAKKGELISASELLARLDKAGEPADRTTVYRELAFLKKAGLAREIVFRGRPSLFEMEGEHHHHLVCQGCGAFAPVKVPIELCRQEERIGKKEKFKITSHSLEFYGLCRKCQ